MRGRAGVVVIILTALAAGAAASLGASGREVRIPHTGGSILVAYARLHSVGFRVSVAGPWTFTPSVSVARTSPAVGERVPVGAVVTLYVSRSAVPVRVRPVSVYVRPPVRAPRFLTRQVSAAYAWALVHQLGFTAHLDSLQAGSAPQLLANFVVSRQRPSRGRRGTALAVWGRQPAPAPRPAPPSPPPPPAVATIASAAPAPVTTTSALPPPTGPTGPTGPQPLAAGTYYENPVYSAAAFPDPFVLDNGDTHSDYWAFGTGNLFPILHSSDLVHWTAAGTALTSTPTWVTSGDWHPWAPSVIQSSHPCPGSATGACYVMYYVGLNASLSRTRNCIAVATSPTPGGPYTDQGPLVLAGAPSGGAAMPIGCGDSAGVGNIDPSPFIDPAGGATPGKAYLYLSTDNACTAPNSCSLKPTISVIPLTSDLLEASGARVPLFSGNPTGWEDDSVPAPTVEGPSMEFHNGTYYLFYSGGSYIHAYGMGYATSTSPTGTFTKAAANPFFAATPSAPSVGGGDRQVTGPHGGLWMVYAARTSPSAARTLWIDPFNWKPAAAAGAPDVPVVAGPTTTPQSLQP